MSQKKKKVSMEDFRQQTLQQVKRDIQQQGYSVVLVEGLSQGRPNFAYTVGLAPGAPEMIAMGLPLTHLEALFKTVQMCRSLGNVYQTGNAYRDILIGFPCYLEAVERQYYQEWLKVANYYHRTIEYPCWQVVWPDEMGKFPWEKGFDHRYDKAQQLLFTPPGVVSQ